MKIAIVRTSLHRGSGQVQHIKELASQLRKRGHSLTVYSRSIEADMEPIPTVNVLTPCGNIPFIRHFTFPIAFRRRLTDADLVHTQYHPDIFAGNYLRRRDGTPHVFTYHGFAPIGVWRSAKQRIKMVDHRIGTFLGLRGGVDRIIAVSHFLRRELEKRYFVDPEKIHVIYNGVDLERFKPALDPSPIRRRFGLANLRTVLYVGRLVPYKGAQFLLKAVPRILEAHPRTRFLIVGSPRYDSPNIGRLLRNKKIRESLIFAGHVKDDDLPYYYTACEVFCFPSLWEGFGLPPAEAQACAKPVVAFNHCALPEVIADGKTGILVPPKDSGAVADAIVRLLDDEDERVRMGWEGRRRVEALFRWDKAAEETVRVYERAVEGS